MTKRILITGIAGLLGSYFSRYLLNKNYEIIGIDDFSGGYKENIVKGIQCYKINLCDFEKVNSFFKKQKIDCIYHFAAYAAEGLSPFIRKYNYENNVIASANLITSAINYDIEKIIFTSSMAVYGDENKAPFDESMTPKPIDPYGIAKYAVEMDLNSANKQFGLNYTIIRPHNVIGIYQNIWDKYRNVIGIWIRKTLDKEDLCVFGDGTQKRAFSDMQYYNEPLEKVMQEYNSEIFNIGANKEITLLETAKLVQKCANNFGYKPNIIHLEPRYETKYAYCNHNKAEKLLNFKDNTDLELTINNMFEWALKQPKRKVKYMKYETSKSIYSYWR